MASSDLVPSDLKRPGLLRQAVSGCIVALRERSLAVRDRSGESGSASQKGKGKKRSKGPSTVKEFHLNGGNSPASVVLVEIWIPEVQARVGSILQVGQAVRLTRCQIMSHHKDSMKFTTSRLGLYLRAVADTEITQIECAPEWLRYHPTTSVSDLQCLPPQRPVCVAGRLVEPAPAKKTVKVDGEEIAVANATLRNGDELIRMALWREQASLVNSLELGTIYMCSSFVKHVRQDVEGFELRATSMSSITSCPSPLVDKIDESTPSSGTGGRMWTTVPGGRRDWAVEEAHWWTLSVCEQVITPKVARDVDILCQVASVFIECDDGVLTYAGCSKCKKAWRGDDPQPCSCGEAEQTEYWCGKLTLTDHTGQLKATCFDAFESVAAFHDESATPQLYAKEDSRQELLAAIAAVPFTARIGFDDDAYADRTRAVVRLLAPTFDVNHGVKHPLCLSLTFLSDGASIPPCRLSDTVFNAGIGMALLHGSAVSSFRVLLRITDNARGAKRSESGDMVKVNRSALCMLQDPPSESPVAITQHAALDEATRFLQVPKDGSIHAIVAWRDSCALTLMSLWQLPGTDVEQFRKFFRREVEIFDESRGLGKKHELSSYESPLRIARAASDMSSSSAKQAWSARAKLDFGSGGA